MFCFVAHQATLGIGVSVYHWMFVTDFAFVVSHCCATLLSHIVVQQLQLWRRGVMLPEVTSGRQVQVYTPV